MPVIARFGSALEPRAAGRDVVSVVESHQAGAVRRVQRERVRQAMRSLRRHVNATYLELDPVTLFEMMDTSIERQQELEATVPRTLIDIL